MPIYTADLNPIPDDIYARFNEQLTNHELHSMALLNGADYAAHFPPYLSSIDSMIGQHLRIGGKPTYGQFPFHAMRFKASAPFTIPAIEAVYHTNESKAIQDFFARYINTAQQLSAIVHESTTGISSIRDILAGEFHAIIHLGNTVVQLPWFESNINQRHRAAQLAFVEDGIAERLEYAADLLTQYCHARGLQWSIRPPIAFQGMATHQLYERNPLVGIHDDAWHIPAPMHFVKAVIPPTLADKLWGMRRPYNDFGGMFRFWEHRAAYGLIWAPATGDTQGLNTHEFAIIPRSTPSALYSRFDLGAPLYTSIAPGLSPCDSHARVIYGSNEGDLTDFLAIQTSLESGTDALAVLNYITLGLSILVATIPMGKGNHKPAWTNSPLNTSLIRALHTIQRPLLERFRSIV